MSFGAALVVPSPWVPLGFGQYTVSSTVVKTTDAPTSGTAANALTFNGLTISPNHAIADVETNDIRVRDDSTNPSATVGQLVRASSQMRIENSSDAILQLRMIRASADATVTIRYYL